MLIILEIGTVCVDSVCTVSSDRLVTSVAPDLSVQDSHGVDNNALPYTTSNHSTIVVVMVFFFVMDLLPSNRA